MPGILARIRRDLTIKLDEATPKTRGRTRKTAAEETEWDVFIAHASEDKDGFVRPLAQALSTKLQVWYDDSFWPKRCENSPRDEVGAW